MPIQAQDIKIFESDTMADVPEGGGGMTGNVIIDGESNNIFEDISTLDRVYGAVHMRKVFPGVFTQTQDKYFGAHVIISKLPGDQKIGVNLFNTQDWFDRRPVAQSRVENYRAQGAVYAGFLWATQYAGSRAVTIFQGETAPVPGIGDVLLLVGPSTTQYIRITRMEQSIQTFTDAQGTFKRRILEIEISEVLKANFVGAEISRFDTLTPSARIFQTVVANAARYYSARTLLDAGEVGDLSVKVDSVYSQVVPSAQSEVPILDQNAGGSAATLINGSQENYSFNTSMSFSAGVVCYIGSTIYPGTLSVSTSGGTLTDEGGQLKSGTTTIGTVDYAQGELVFGPTSPTYSGSKTISFRPGAAPIRLADTVAIEVTAANRGYVYTININPAPQPGALRVAFRALNNWYELADNGVGGLLAVESGIGTGSVNYATGSAQVTLGVLPDAESKIIFSWGTAADFYNRSDLLPEPMKIRYQLANDGIDAGTLSISWNDGQARQITSDAIGNLTGDGTGKLNRASGALEFSPNSLPLGGTEFTVDYQHGPKIEESFAHPIRNAEGHLELTMQNTDLIPNTIEVEWNLIIDESVAMDLITSRWVDPIKFSLDDGAGLLNDVDFGTVDYVNGVIEWEPDLTVQIPRANYEIWRPLADHGPPPRKVYIGRDYVDAPAFYPNDLSGYVKIRYRAENTTTSASETITLETLELDLTQGFNEDIVPGSVLFTFGGRNYIDRNGQLYYNINPQTNAGTYAGTIDYSSGVCTLNNWSTGAANSITLRALVTTMNFAPVDQAVFRTPSAPVKVQSFSVRAVPEDGGNQIEATANPDGTITADFIDGFIEYETGVVDLLFGDWRTAAGNENEDWYDPESIIEGEIFVSKPVFAETIVFNAVSVTFLPLSSEILGLDPVRLPQDGRIPVYSPGDVVVILNDQTTIGTFSNAQVTDLGRGRIAKLSIRDSANQEIETSRYTADLDAGEITWNDLSGVSQPLTITDRIEDMAVLTDVQITGTLSLSQPLTHNFPANNTLVSNAVIYGDLFARTSTPFDQQTWTNVWSDQRIGSDTVAQYNNGQHPIEVDNASAIQERWALIFTGSSAVNVVGENVGQILSSVSIGVDIAPINPNTGQPYFVIPADGWGSGWSSGNVLRFNTIAANAPVWIIQSVGQGEATDDDYTFCLEMRGDIDTP